jgi:hypothetical protein
MMSTMIRKAFALTFIMLCIFSPTTLVQSKRKDKKSVPSGRPVLWKTPANISSRNLYLGPGGTEMRPNTGNLTYLREDKSGTSPKFRVKDGLGREWVAKLGKEAQSETAAVRLLWAVGYPTEVNYLIPCAHISGAPRPKKKAYRCEGNGFANVRLEARPKNVERTGQWKWNRNPFVGTRELQGLVVLMGLINNWDLKDSNNIVLYVPSESGNSGVAESQYAISDLGATFGKTGNLPFLWRLTRSRNNPKHYYDSRFIDKIKGNRVAFRYGGKNRSLFKNIRITDAKWIGELLSRLNGRQIEDAFRAANYNPGQVKMLTEAVERRIDELNRLSSPGLRSVMSPLVNEDQ